MADRSSLHIVLGPFEMTNMTGHLVEIFLEQLSGFMENGGGIYCIEKQFNLHPLVQPPGNPIQIHRDQTHSLHIIEKALGGLW